MKIQLTQCHTVPLRKIILLFIHIRIVYGVSAVRHLLQKHLLNKHECKESHWECTFHILLCIHILLWVDWNLSLTVPSGAGAKEPACQCRRHKEMWVWSLGGEDPLEEGVAAHSSIFAWRAPWTEESGGLQFIESHRVGHDWSGWAHTHDSFTLIRTVWLRR